MVVHEAKNASRAAEIALCPGLQAFLNVPRIELTNNARERSLGHAVIRLKLPFGTYSAGGSRLVETIPTVVETRRQQFRSAFVTEAVQSHFAHHSTSSLFSGT